MRLSFQMGNVEWVKCQTPPSHLSGGGVKPGGLRFGRRKTTPVGVVVVARRCSDGRRVDELLDVVDTGVVRGTFASNGRG